MPLFQHTTLEISRDTQLSSGVEIPHYVAEMYLTSLSLHTEINNYKNVKLIKDIASCKPGYRWFSVVRLNCPLHWEDNESNMTQFGPEMTRKLIVFMCHV